MKKFTTPCFIRKNTPELRKKLEELGYNRHFLHLDGDPYLHTWVGEQSCNAPGFSAIPADSVWCPEHPEYEPFNTIDCGDNEALFLALAALNDTDDREQWFVCKELITGPCGIHHKPGEFSKIRWEDDRCWRKATPSELIEHFNK